MAASELQRIREAHEQQEQQNLERVLREYVEFDGDVSPADWLRPSSTPWTQEPPTKTVSTPLFEDENTAQSVNQVSQTQDEDMRVADMSPADLRVYITQTVFEAMDAWQEQQAPAPEPEYIQADEPDIASLMAGMSAEDIQEAIAEFIDSMQQDQSIEVDAAANDNSPQPEGDDPKPPSPLRQQLAQRAEQHTFGDEQDDNQKQAIAY